MTKQEAFIKELTALSKKHNLWIAGCGCCNSPWANSLDEEKQIPEYDWMDWGDGELEMICPMRKEVL